MKREIKFRAWDKKNKVMYIKISALFLEKNAIEGNNNVRCWTGSQILKYNQCDIMQYTGLDDKNDKEIYEGDVVKYSNNCEYYNFIGQIEWNYSRMSYIIIGHYHGNLTIIAINSNCMDLEVIGNIYENPELIKN